MEGRMKVEVATAPEILAMHNGRCPGCHAAIRKGEPIKEIIATGKYVHPECVPVEEANF
jgi:hypothetical protein